MFLGNMTKKQFLQVKVAYSSDKIVAICGFVKIQRPISSINRSITIIFRCPTKCFWENDEKNNS